MYWCQAKKNARTGCENQIMRSKRPRPTCSISVSETVAAELCRIMATGAMRPMSAQVKTSLAPAKNCPSPRASCTSHAGNVAMVSGVITSAASRALGSRSCVFVEPGGRSDSVP